MAAIPRFMGPCHCESLRFVAEHMSNHSIISNDCVHIFYLLKVMPWGSLAIAWKLRQAEAGRSGTASGRVRPVPFCSTCRSR